jgi:hypothetical protein
MSGKIWWRRLLLAGGLSSVVLLAGHADAAEQPEGSVHGMVCGAASGATETCPFGFEATEVVLERSLAGTTCTEGGNWRATARAVTVEAGCIARFQVTSALERPRVLIMTDIGQDPDDMQSLVRTLLYANDIRIEGIIPTYRPGNRAVGADLVRAVLRAYEKDLPQLRRHDIRYPDADWLRERVKLGLRTNRQIGPGHDSAGSNHLVRTVDASDEPLWVLVWGGSRELAQALHKVRSTRSAASFALFQKKLRVYTIGWSQYSPEPAEYLKAYAKDMMWIASSSYDGGKDATFRGMYMLGDNSMQDRAWTEQHVTGQGHLGRMYPIFTTEDGLKEGDTPSLLHVLPIGLNDPEQPAEGGWGGRYGQEEAFAHVSRHFHSSRNMEDRVGDEVDRRLSVARWRPAFQADFAARAAWLEQDYHEANHPPEPAVLGDTTRRVRPGDKVVLDATPSGDPDDDRLTFRWWIYQEASSMPADDVPIEAHDAVAALLAPAVERPETLSIVLEVQDDGSPSLTRYQRIRLTVEP